MRRNIVNSALLPTHSSHRTWLAVGLIIATIVAACSGAASNPPTAAGPGDRLRVSVTTDIIADLVRNVGGDRVDVSSVVPTGGDPHSYDPTPADAERVSAADVAFTNHMLLEDHPLIKLFDSNVRAGVPNVSLAEVAERYGAHLIPLVENVALDTIWLGLAVRGAGPNRSADVHLRAVAVDGPGDLFTYVTDAFGQPEIYFDSSDGIDERDVAILPPGAHTHVNWAFTAPGVYRLTLAGGVDPDGTGEVAALGEATFTFAVGIDPRTAGGSIVLDEGHADLSVDLGTGKVFVCTAPLSCATQVGDVDGADAVIDVPNKAIALVPDAPAFAFLGDPGAQIWELPQVVLGKHVHGVVDPHLWEDVKNARAYVGVIAETLIATDPDGAATYTANAERYGAQLDGLDRYVAERVATIPETNRQLITTHDAFSYLANAYGLTVAGFVVPNPAQEPSAVQVARLTEAIRNLGVKAVFAEPNLHTRANVLRQVAEDNGVQDCMLYGDTFDPNIGDYIGMMRHNADELARCLGGAA
jgi:anchored repeat ABC transporter substrate-binding protein